MEARPLGQAHEGCDIEVNHPGHLVDVGFEKRCRRADARIVDQHGDAGVSTQRLFDPREICFVVQVGSDDRDGTPGVVGDACRQRFKPSMIAGDED